MRKIPSLFQRNYDTDRLVRDEVVPGCEWVLAKEGLATRKWDGVCTMVRDGLLYKRYELKPGKVAPTNWEACDEVDEKTGKQMGWVPVGDGPEDAAMRAAFDGQEANGTYEFLGPKSQGNVEGWPIHVLLPHGETILHSDPRTFESLKAYFEDANIEGIVWHHSDGRMCKIKAKDFGFKRRSNNAK